MEVADYLRDEPELGGDNAARLHTRAGLPMGYTTLIPPYSQAEAYLDVRLVRLMEFIAELARK